MTDFRTNYNGCLPFSNAGRKMSMQAGVEATWTVPGVASDIYRAQFSYAESAEVWVALNATVVVPVAGVPADTYNEEFRPDVRYVKGGDVLHFISTGTPQVGVSLLKVPG